MQTMLYYTRHTQPTQAGWDENENKYKKMFNTKLKKFGYIDRITLVDL